MFSDIKFIVNDVRTLQASELYGKLVLLQHCNFTCGIGAFAANSKRLRSINHFLCHLFPVPDSCDLFKRCLLYAGNLRWSISHCWQTLFLKAPATVYCLNSPKNTFLMLIGWLNCTSFHRFGQHPTFFIFVLKVHKLISLTLTTATSPCSSKFSVCSSFLAAVISTLVDDTASVFLALVVCISSI